MGLLDQLAGLFLNKKDLPFEQIIQWIESQGNLTGLLNKLKQSGLTEIVQSWLGGDNKLPISGDQLTNALGTDSLQQLAGKVGVNVQMVTGMLSKYLPDLVGHIVSTGQDINTVNSDSLLQSLNSIKDKLGL